MQLPAQRTYLARAERVQPLSKLFRWPLARSALTPTTRCSAPAASISPARSLPHQCARNARRTQVTCFSRRRRSLGSIAVQRAKHRLRRDPNAAGVPNKSATQVCCGTRTPFPGMVPIVDTWVEHTRLGCGMLGERLRRRFQLQLACSAASAAAGVSASRSSRRVSSLRNG